MRTVAEMVNMVRELVHDRTEKYYSPDICRARLLDAYGDLIDRLLADDMGHWVLAAAGASTAASGGTPVPVPSDCLRVRTVQVLDGSGRWRTLSRVESDPPPPEGLGSSTALAVGTTYVLNDPLPLAYSNDESGASIRLEPETHGTATIRFLYWREPPFPTSTTGRLALPRGGSELLEFLAADKLITVEPKDQKRIATYAAMFEARFRSYCEGIGRGKLNRAQTRPVTGG